ncbi:MAG: hypothetical protein NTZ33_11755 [Bacteroidetes bacterium]|nr:hypothetical protein [Bacteroidota bacterium]
MEDNEENPSAIDKLIAFTEKTNRKIYFAEYMYPGILSKNANHKRTVYIPDTAEELIFLIAYQDPKSMSENELFFGAFFPISISTSSTMNIRKKDIIDKINPFLKHKIFKTGTEQFDASAIISGNDETLVSKYFLQYNMQNLVLDSLDISNAINIGINELDLDFVPAFKNKSHIGIFTRQKWLVDNAIIEKLFKNIEMFRKHINE